MTREEKIELLEFVRQGLLINARVKSDYDIAEALGTAISALKGPTREQVETKLKAEWVPHKKNDDFSSYYTCSKCGAKFGESCGINFFERDFCPMCGSPVTDNGVDEVRKRLEEVQND